MSGRQRSTKNRVLCIYKKSDSNSIATKPIRMKSYRIPFEVSILVRIPEKFQKTSNSAVLVESLRTHFPSLVEPWRLVHLGSLFRDPNYWEEAISQSTFSLGVVEDVSSTDSDLHASPMTKYSETSLKRICMSVKSDVRSWQKGGGRENIHQPFHIIRFSIPANQKRKSSDPICIDNLQKKHFSLDKRVHEEDGNHKDDGLMY